MARSNTIPEILNSLKAQDWTPVSIVTSDSDVGRVELVVFTPTTNPSVKFRAIPVNSFKLPQNFDDMESALRYVGFKD